MCLELYFLTLITPWECVCVRVCVCDPYSAGRMLRAIVIDEGIMVSGFTLFFHRAYTVCGYGDILDGFT